jgi:hypothetical protein
MHRCAQYCNIVRRRLLIWLLKQSVNIRDPASGGRSREFESRHPDHYFQNRVNRLQRPLPGHCLFVAPNCGGLAGTRFSPQILHTPKSGLGFPNLNNCLSTTELECLLSAAFRPFANFGPHRLHPTLSGRSAHGYAYLK